VEIEPTFESWQAAARRLLCAGAAPADVRWREVTTGTQPSRIKDAAAPRRGIVKVPRRFLDLARRAAASTDPERWHVLYETLWRLVHESHDLLDDARDPAVRRLETLAASPGSGATGSEGAAPLVPAGAGIAELREAAARCTGCDLYRHATQTVFGLGAPRARIVLVGEQPGDQEDRQGAPFVGPAGEVLDRALAEVGIARRSVYVTNAVKHFKFETRGKRRIHQTPRANEIAACRPWLEAEMAAINPEILVCLGATAARVIFGDSFRITRDRGRFATTPWAPKTIATYHPSAVLRGRDEAEQARLYAMFVEDLRKVADAQLGRVTPA
jgi:DNA polymerase